MDDRAMTDHRSILRWADAADMLCEHPTEADARECSIGLTVVLHRWPTGPWLADDETIWDGDGQLLGIHAQRFAAENLADRHQREAGAGESGRVVQWFCRDDEGRETFLAPERHEDRARHHQARFANLAPSARCALIRRTTITEVIDRG